MSANLIPVKTYLGKFYSELSDTVLTSQKYQHTNINSFFEQRFFIQNNKVQMIVDVTLKGLRIVVSGNEIYVSKELYKHPSIDITNSIEEKSKTSDPRSLYSSKTFSTIAYLICQNHTLFKVIGDIDEPIYITFKSEYEAFYSSVLLFMVNAGVSVNIVEEIESHCAINSVVNYILNPYAALNVSTFYKNQRPALSFFFRNIIAQVASTYNHLLLGRGSSNVVDENRILLESEAMANVRGKIDVSNSSFHSIVEVTSSGHDNFINIDYRNTAKDKGTVTFTPVLEVSGLTTINLNADSLVIDDDSSILVTPTVNTPMNSVFTKTNINNRVLDPEELRTLVTDDVDENEAIDLIISDFSKEISDRVGIHCQSGTERYYDIKNKFLG